MAGVKPFWGLFLALFIYSCETTGIDNNPQTPVEEYIFAMRGNRYEEIRFPDLSANHITQLLDFGNETRSTHTFPHDPLVCFMIEDETKVGVVALWTIESIRKSYVEAAEELIYPSADPLLIARDTLNEDFNYHYGHHQKAYQAYKLWWGKDLPLGEKMKINPLEGSDIKWR